MKKESFSNDLSTSTIMIYMYDYNKHKTFGCVKKLISVLTLPQAISKVDFLT